MPGPFGWDDPAFLGIVEMMRAYGSRGMSTVNVARAQFERIHEHNEHIYAFTLICAYPADFEEFPNRRACTPYTPLFNLTQLTQQPAISVPAGLTHDGLPIGLHIAGPRNAEAKILRAAYAYAQAAPFTQLPILNDRSR